MSGRNEAAALLTERVQFELVPIQNTPANPLANAFRFAEQLRRSGPTSWSPIIGARWNGRWEISSARGCRMSISRTGSGLTKQSSG